MGVAVIAACPKDAWLSQKTLEWAADLGDKFDHLAVVFVETGTDYEPLFHSASRLFKEVIVHQYDPYVGPSAWPQPQNYAWQTAARFMDSVKRGPWFWWEPDVTPLRKGWLDILFREYEKGGKPFMGHVSKAMGHMNGVAIYPETVSDHATDALLVMRMAFDVALWREIRMKVNDASNIMAHLPRYNGVQLTFKDKKTVQGLLNKEFVVFHGCNDGSLIDYLRGRKPTLQNIAGRLLQAVRLSHIDGAVDESEACWHQHKQHLKRVGYDLLPYEDCTKSVPAIEEQVDWECGLFPLGLSDQLCYFNPALIRLPSGLFLLPRRWTRSGERWVSRIAVHRLVDMHPSPFLDAIKLPAMDSLDQHEDPRAFLFPNGKIGLSWCGWRHGRDYIAHQSFSVLDQSFSTLSTLNPVYGGNGHRPGAGTGNEKNWVWFPYDNRLHMVYSFKPHTVVEMHDEQRFTTHKTAVTTDWEHGEIRGGTPPVLTAEGYVSFFHSSLPWKGRQKRYYVGAYVFEPAPPFRVLKYTPEPLFAGSEMESRTLGGPLVVFPCGALLEDDKWLLTYGVNDERCGWMKIPHDDLMERMS